LDRRIDQRLALVVRLLPLEAISEALVVVILFLVVISVLFAILFPEKVESNEDKAGCYDGPEPERSLNGWIFDFGLFHLNLILGEPSIFIRVKFGEDSFDLKVGGAWPN